ncbi:L-histidine N(alpha)-methyltransferase [Aliterella atlantica]|uniref:Methyltransferase n=1 Tax=Aliterella atlantica CENA595 TaxID=1618023 RepID=A0A0D8ZV30_9CYAN|nr:L-histidine N(alpha)-methyltransferase [Aliterella atlantica]KJH72309.1 methyltransferase [Aliterella atlantica CENA595]
MSISKTASSNIDERLQVEHLLSVNTLSAQQQIDASDVVKGLTQTPKSLPARYFYDDYGSMLFEQICELPEYYLTRTETAILQQYASAIAQITGACELVELGSGSSTKTRILLDAYNCLGYPLRYIPIDVSAGILESSARLLLADYSSLQVQALVSTYELALKQLKPSQSDSRVICFIGSSLGNLNPQECQVFFSQVTAALAPGEYFLLGVDLHKSKDLLEAAYNDSQEVTAAFNLNMLKHLNQRFDGNFNLKQFKHQAFYNEERRQIEMHLRSMRSQTVELRDLNLIIELDSDETILTEISRKFDLNELKKDLQTQGLKTLNVWMDDNKWFGLLLCQMQS